MASFSLALRQMSSSCEFGSFLPEAPRDQFVCGLSNQGMQRKLLAEANLTLDRALQLATAMSMATENTVEFHTDTLRRDTHTVNKVSKNVQAKTYAKSSSYVCWRCAKPNHSPDVCRFKEAVCHGCKQKGHIIRACKKRQSTGVPQKGAARYVVDCSEETINTTDEEDNMLGIYSAERQNNKTKPVVLLVSLEGVDCEIHVDTGATVSLVSKAFYKERFPRVPLENTHIELKAYAGHNMPVCGQINVSVSYQEQSGVFPSVVVDNDGPPLLGRNWLNKIRLNWDEIFAVSETESVSSVLNRHQAVFKPGLGNIKGHKADIQVKDGVSPVFRKAMPVPYAVKEKVDREIERLEHEGVIKKLESSAWASSIVCVPKRNGSIRICGDFKVSVNPVLISNPYPLPNAEDLFAKLAGGKIFSKLDLSNAYQQLELTEESQKYLTINTQKGVYAYQRLTFGIATAPSIFQAVMDQILQGMANVVCYMDDILISSRTDEEHLQHWMKYFLG